MKVLEVQRGISYILDWVYFAGHFRNFYLEAILHISQHLIVFSFSKQEIHG